MAPGLTIKPEGEDFSDLTGFSVAINEEESRETENSNRPVIEIIIVVFLGLMLMGLIKMFLASKAPSSYLQFFYFQAVGIILHVIIAF
jgi:hypothetical protein